MLRLLVGRGTLLFSSAGRDMTRKVIRRQLASPELDVRAKVHDTSRLEWTAELPLPMDRASEDFVLEAEIEVPSAVWTDHDSWAHLQLFARLASPTGDGDDGISTGNVDGLRRATLAAVRRLKVRRESLEHEIFTAASLFSRAPRESLGDMLFSGVQGALEEVRQARAVLGSPPITGGGGELQHERQLALEFLSNHALEFLSRLQRAVDDDLCGPRCRHRDVYGEVARRLRPLIARALAEELSFRDEQSFLRLDPEDPDSLERYVDRASLLKKHFQELLFLRAETEFLERRFKNWFAVAAAMAASVWAFPLGLVLTSDRMAGVGVGFGATVLLFSLMYAVKDRIKESVRGWLADRIIRGYGGRLTTLHTPPRVLPEPRQLARLRESIDRVPGTRPDPLNPDLGAMRPVVLLRHVVRGTVEAEPRLAEQNLTGLKLVIRYDLSPLFSRLDDAVRRIPVLADDGRVRFAEAPRAYRMPLGLRLRTRGRLIEEHRILVVHKLGLERLDMPSPMAGPAYPHVEHRSAQVGLTKSP